MCAGDVANSELISRLESLAGGSGTEAPGRIMCGRHDLDKQADPAVNAVQTLQGLSESESERERGRSWQVAMMGTPLSTNA